MRLLADHHHADLFESHQIVFGDRFGWEVYAPFGMEWFDEAYWQFELWAHGDAVARQYLLGIWNDAQPDANGIVRVPVPQHPGRMRVGITLEAARSMQFDIVMSSVPTNGRGFRRLAGETGAKWLIHIGNQWGDEEVQGLHPDGMILTTTSDIIAEVPRVTVHQEFSLDDFRYEPPRGLGPIRSFVNCFQETPEYPIFQRVARSIPEFDWQVYGALGTGEADEFTKGAISGTPKLGDAMREASVIWHTKHWSDGFGHIIHNAFAVGRPVFGYARYYADKLAGPLWVEGVTSMDVENLTIEEIAARLQGLRDDPERHAAMCEASGKRFREIVSFDEDAEKIKGLLERVLSDRLVAA